MSCAASHERPDGVNTADIYLYKQYGLLGILVRNTATRSAVLHNTNVTRVLYDTNGYFLVTFIIKYFVKCVVIIRVSEAIGFSKTSKCGD